MTYVPVPLNAISGVFYTLAVLIGLLVLAALRQGHNARRDRERLDAFTAYMQWLEADYERRTGVKPRPPVHVRRGTWRHRRKAVSGRPVLRPAPPAHVDGRRGRRTQGPHMAADAGTTG